MGLDRTDSKGQELSLTKPWDNFLYALIMFQHQKYHLSIYLQYSSVQPCTVLSYHVLFCAVLTLLRIQRTQGKTTST